MYKFLVVEDEQYARKSIASILEELNGGGVREAENGAAALHIIESEEIDAVITDIQMPVMDGIELIRALNRNQERVAVAVLSGHDEFSYVQTAVECSVVDYVLKPFNRGDIMRLYYKVLRKLRARESMEREIGELMRRSNRIRPFIKQRFFLDLIGGGVDGIALEEMRDYLNLRLGDRPLELCLVEVDARGSALRESDDQTKYCLFNILETIGHIVSDWRDTDCFDVSNDMLALIWCPTELNEDSRELFENVETLIDEMNNIYGVMLNAAISGVAENPRQIPRAYREARELLKYKLVYGGGQVFDWSRMRDMGARRSSLPDAEGIVEAVWRNEPEEALRRLEEVLADITRNAARYGLASVKLFFQKILTDCLIHFEREGGSIAELNQRLGLDCLEWRASGSSREEALAFFRRFFPEICKIIQRGRSSERKRVVAEAKRMIAEQYVSSVSVEALARELHFSKNYFGQMFKAETGMSVGEYVNLFRIQRAKALIMEDRLKMYEIAEQCGFSDQQYFAKVFKKIVGCMPTEYKR